MKIVAHKPEPVQSTFSIEGLTEQEVRTLLAFVGSIGDTEGAYLVASTPRDYVTHLGDGRYGSLLRDLCDSLYDHLHRALRDV